MTEQDRDRLFRIRAARQEAILQGAELFSPDLEFLLGLLDEQGQEVRKEVLSLVLGWKDKAVQDQKFERAAAFRDLRDHLVQRWKS